MMNAVFETLLLRLFQIMAGLIQWLRLVPHWVWTGLLAGLAWAIVFMTLWNLFAASRDTVKRAQTMHQIPCANCQFFTNDYRLKCTVHPNTALTESAIGCRDFDAALGMSAYVPGDPSEA